MFTQRHIVPLPKIYITQSDVLVLHSIGNDIHLYQAKSRDDAEEFARQSYRAEMLRFGHVLPPTMRDVKIETILMNNVDRYIREKKS